MRHELNTKTNKSSL